MEALCAVIIRRIYAIEVIGDLESRIRYVVGMVIPADSALIC